MTPSNSIAVNLIRHPARVASFVFKSLWAVVVLLFVCLLWLVLFLLFLPLIFVGELFGLKKRLATEKGKQNFRRRKAKSGRRAPLSHSRWKTAVQTILFLIDESDVSKLFGCNTRNVQYRWSLFEERLRKLKSEFTDLKAIDFGAGSLRDSYELSKLGFNLVSVDLDQSLMQRYSEFYDWRELPSTPQLFARPLDDLVRETGADSFHPAIAFDVIEHLEDPSAYVRKIRLLLKPRGLFFTIVPNRLSVFERYFKYSIAKQRRRGIAWIPGVPHLQFKTPTEWEVFFADNGYKVLDHEMAIGPFVNDMWHGLIGLPLIVFVEPVLRVLAHKFHLRHSTAFVEGFCPAWLMERVEVWDHVLKRWLSPRFGWNLFVLKREATAN